MDVADSFMVYRGEELRKGITRGWDKEYDQNKVVRRRNVKSLEPRIVGKLKRQSGWEKSIKNRFKPY